MLISFISTEYKTSNMPILLKITHFIISTIGRLHLNKHCLLYTSDAADDMQCVDLGGRRIIKKYR